MTASLRALSYRFGVHTGDPQLRRQVAELFAALGDVGSAEHVYSLDVTVETPGGGGGVDVHRDSELVARCQSRVEALSWLVWDVNRSAAESSTEYLLLHAGALQTPGPGHAGILLPGVSGSGKSTLSAWLARAGLPYLTDELVALDLATGRLLPYPKPITMKPAVGSAQERHLAVGDGSVGRVGKPCIPGFVVFPRYVPGAPTSLQRLNETEAFLELAANAVNFADHGDDATAALGGLVSRCACARLVTSDADEAGRLVLGLVGVPGRDTDEIGVELGAKHAS
jgi:hypothetical protein